MPENERMPEKGHMPENVNKHKGQGTPVNENCTPDNVVCMLVFMLYLALGHEMLLASSIEGREIFCITQP